MSNAWKQVYILEDSPLCEIKCNVVFAQAIFAVYKVVFAGNCNVKC